MLLWMKTQRVYFYFYFYHEIVFSSIYILQNIKRVTNKYKRLNIKLCPLLQKLNSYLIHDSMIFQFMVLSCIDTVEVTLSDWRDTTLVLERLISEKFGTDCYSDEANVICYLFGVPVCPFSFNCIIVICNPCLDGIIVTLDKIQKPTFRSRAFWSFTSDTHSSMFR